MTVIDDNPRDETSAEIIVLKPAEQTQDAEPQTTTEDLWGEICANPWFWHDPDKEPYVTVQINGHHENHRLNGRTFKLLMQREFYKRLNEMPKPQVLAEQFAVV